MNKKILVSLSMISAVAAIAIGGTVAYFSDIETSTGNTFTAGTLDLNLDGGNVNVVKFTLANLKPGDLGNGTWAVANVGSLDGYLDLEAISVTEAIGATTDSELADEPTGVDVAQLGTYLLIHLFVDTNNNGVFDSGETDIYGTATAPLPIKDISGNYGLDLSLAANGGTNYIRLNWNIPTTTDNQIQGDSVTLSITFELAQTAGQ